MVVNSYLRILILKRRKKIEIMKNNWKKETLSSEKESHIDTMCISVTSMSRK